MQVVISKDLLGNPKSFTGTHGCCGVATEECVQAVRGSGDSQTDADPQADGVPRPAGGDDGHGGARPPSRMWACCFVVLVCVLGGMLCYKSSRGCSHFNPSDTRLG